MIGNLITALILIGLVVLFGWLTKRAWGAKRWFIKFPGVILAGLLTLLLALIAVLGIKGMITLYKPYTPAAANITINSSPQTIARGEHIAAMMCAGCHGMNGQLPLTGGANIADDIQLPLGDIYPPNITPGGRIKDLTDNDIWRIIRTGIRPNSELTFMSTVNTRNLSDEDTLAVIAYLRSTPVVTTQRPPVNYTFLTMLFAGAGLINPDIPSTIPSISAPPKTATKEYGEYIANFMDCRNCHGPTLSADGGPLSPPGTPNITIIVPQWSKDDFFKAMRTGVDNTGHKISPPMPWKTIGLLEDVELEALYNYLHALKPILPSAK